MAGVEDPLGAGGAGGLGRVAVQADISAVVSLPDTSSTCSAPANDSTSAAGSS